MDSKYSISEIEKLVDQFMDGDTSLEEERLLYDFSLMRTSRTHFWHIKTSLLIWLQWSVDMIICWHVIMQVCYVHMPKAPSCVSEI